MATKKNKIYYYILVMSNQGPSFVTSVDYKLREAKWDFDQKPLQMCGEDEATQLTRGLCLNGHTAFTIAQAWEIDRQPYNYAYGHFEWQEKKKEEKVDG